MASGWPGKGHGALLKNSLCASFHRESGTKQADYGAFRARLEVATSSISSFSTGCRLSANFAFTQF
jgi:hypothetical protein